MTPALTLALTLIKPHEGCILHPYQDAAGYWTIGYGCRWIDGTAVCATTPRISQDQADELVAEAAQRVADQIAPMIKVAVSEQEMAALISFAFNLGAGALQHSTLLVRLNAGDRLGAANEFPKWIYAGGKVLPGLVARRRDERAMFLSTHPPAGQIPMEP